MTAKIRSIRALPTFNGKVAKEAIYADYIEQKQLFDNSKYKTYTSTDEYGKDLLEGNISKISRTDPDIYRFKLDKIPEQYRDLFKLLSHLCSYCGIPMIKLPVTDCFTDAYNMIIEKLSSPRYSKYMFKLDIGEIDQFLTEHAIFTTNGLFKLMLAASRPYALKACPDIENPDKCQLAYNKQKNTFDIVDEFGNVIKENIRFKTNLIIDVFVAGFHNMKAKDNIKGMNTKLFLSSFDSMIKNLNYKKQMNPTIEESICGNYKISKLNNSYVRLESSTFWSLYKAITTLLNVEGEEFYDDKCDVIGNYREHENCKPALAYYNNQIMSTSISNRWFKIPDFCCIIPMGLEANWNKPTDRNAEYKSCEEKLNLKIGNVATSCTVRSYPNIITIGIKNLEKIPLYKQILNSNIYRNYKRLHRIRYENVIKLEDFINVTALFDIYLATRIDEKIRTKINRCP